ncbi:unnamed protein product [Leptosia nina]|uniref:Uncharacterized protein n=1 Tax=Leptosia nina TaxID=320188 RepID=A0AAV1K5T2_9NEOP
MLKIGCVLPFNTNLSDTASLSYKRTTRHLQSQFETNSIQSNISRKGSKHSGRAANMYYWNFPLLVLLCILNPIKSEQYLADGRNYESLNSILPDTRIWERRNTRPEVSTDRIRELKHFREDGRNFNSPARNSQVNRQIGIDGSRFDLSQTFDGRVAGPQQRRSRTNIRQIQAERNHYNRLARATQARPLSTERFENRNRITRNIRNVDVVTIESRTDESVIRRSLRTTQERDSINIARRPTSEIRQGTARRSDDRETVRENRNLGKRQISNERRERVANRRTLTTQPNSERETSISCLRDYFQRVREISDQGNQRIYAHSMTRLNEVDSRNSPAMNGIELSRERLEIRRTRDESRHIERRLFTSRFSSDNERRQNAIYVGTSRSKSLPENNRRSVPFIQRRITNERNDVRNVDRRSFRAVRESTELRLTMERDIVERRTVRSDRSRERHSARENQGMERDLSLNYERSERREGRIKKQQNTERIELRQTGRREINENQRVVREQRDNALSSTDRRAIRLTTKRLRVDITTRVARQDKNDARHTSRRLSVLRQQSPSRNARTTRENREDGRRNVVDRSSAEIRDIRIGHTENKEFRLITSRLQSERSDKNTNRIIERAAQNLNERLEERNHNSLRQRVRTSRERQISANDDRNTLRLSSRIDHVRSARTSKDNTIIYDQSRTMLISSDKTESSLPNCWSLILYTLQAIYICHLILKVRNEKGSSKKLWTSSWLSFPSIKVD